MIEHPVVLRILPVSLMQLWNWLYLSLGLHLVMLHTTAGFLSANPSTSCLHSLTRYSQSPINPKAMPYKHEFASSCAEIPRHAIVTCIASSSVRISLSCRQLYWDLNHYVYNWFGHVIFPAHGWYMAISTGHSQGGRLACSFLCVYI